MKITEESIKQELAEMKKASADIRTYLLSVDKKISELDLRYAKLKVKGEISVLKNAKKILEKKG
jgi:hypothetical protein